MTKWICDKKGCGCAPCRCEIQGSFEPVYCILKDAKTYPKWEMYDTSTKYEHVERRMEQTQEEAELPKLTAEVFDRPDCPEWAICAFVVKTGNAFYSSTLQLSITNEGFYFEGSCFNNEASFLQIGGKWDATDWENSLIERPKKTTLPDWCKVGEWVWLDPQKITGANGYEKVTNVDGLGLMFESGLMVCFSHRILQARLRPYNAEEMRGLVGKMVSTKRDCGIITGYRGGEDNKVIVAWEDIRYSAEDLLKINATIDGKPCGVLEHMENGEWKA